MQAEIEKKLERFGLTSSGRDWVMKALNPASDRTCDGVPDQSTTRVLRPEFRAEAIISSPSAATATWDLYIYACPGDVNAVYWCAAPSPADFTTVAPPAGAEYGRIQLQSVVNTQVALGYDMQVTPHEPHEFQCVSPVSRPLSFRHVYKSLTTHLIAAAVANQGTVYAAQFPPRFSNLALAVPTHENLLASYPEVYVIPRPIRLPLSETELMLMSPDAFTGPAKDGAYIPLHGAGPTQPYPDHLLPTAWAEGQGGGFGIFSNASGPYSVTQNSFPSVPVLVRDQQLAWPTYAARPNLLAASATVPQYTGWDSQYDNTNVGIIIYRGMAAAAGGSFGAAVQIKALVGLEIIPRPLAPDRVFAKPAAVYDARAMEVYYTVLHELHQAYPASYNALGALVPIISGLLARLAPHLLPAAMSVGAQVASYLRDRASAPKPPAPRLPPPPPKTPRVKTAALPRRRTVSVRSTKRR